jgi:hypothetical protein
MVTFPTCLFYHSEKWLVLISLSEMVEWTIYNMADGQTNKRNTLFTGVTASGHEMVRNKGPVREETRVVQSDEELHHDWFTANNG